MLESTPDGAAAITSTARELRGRLRVDWAGDNSLGYDGDVGDLDRAYESVTVERSMVSNLPEEVRITGGYSAGALSVSLVRPPAGSGDDAAVHDAAWAYSGLNPDSPIAAYPVERRPVSFVVTAGGDAFPLFAGLTRTLPTDTDDGTADLTALDTERLRGRVRLPMAVADQRDGVVAPGLNAQWIVDWLLRTRGLYLTPPLHTDEWTVLSATMHGSAVPEVGDLYDAIRVEVDGVTKGPVTYEQGRWGLAPTPPPFDPGRQQIAWTPRRSTPRLALTFNDGATWAFECWVRRPESPAPSTSAAIDLQTGFGDFSLVRAYLLSDGQMVVRVQRHPNLSFEDFYGPVAAAGTENDWHYLGVHVKFTGNTVTVQQRLDGASTSAGVTTANTVNRGGHTGVQLVIAWGSLQLEALQIWHTDGTTPEWRDTWTPHVHLDPSENELTAILPPDDPVEVLDELNTIAAAEFAVAGFDGNGAYRYRTRDRLVSTEGQTSQRTLTTAQTIKTIAEDRSIDRVRNIVTAAASPVSVSVRGAVWSPSEVIGVGARATVTLVATFANPVVDVPPDWWWDQTNHDFNTVIANTADDGTGTISYLGLRATTIARNARSMTIRITNMENRVLYAVHPGGANGLIIKGRQITGSTSGITVQATHEASRAEYGDQVLQLPANRYRQSIQFAAAMCSSAIGDLAWPVPLLTGVEVVGDPRLELADRVTLVTRDGVSLGDWWLTKVTTRFGNGGLSQSLAARRATTVAVWGTSRWGDSVAWGQAVVPEDPGPGPITSRAWTIQSGPTGQGTTIGTAAALSWEPGSTPAGTTDIRHPVFQEMAFRITSTAENSTTDWTTAYRYAEDILDGRGITGGLVGFTSATADMLAVVVYYVDLKPVGNILEPWIEGLEATTAYGDTVDEADYGVDGGGASDIAAAELGAAFIADWEEAADTDPLFRKAQRDLRHTMYWEPALEAALADGVGALGLALYYDTCVNHGVDPSLSYDGSFDWIRANTAATKPISGGNERTWLRAFIAVRSDVLTDWGDNPPDGRISTFNALTLPTTPNYMLTGLVSWSIYGGSFNMNRPDPPDDSVLGDFVLRYTATPAGYDELTVHVVASGSTSPGSGGTPGTLSAGSDATILPGTTFTRTATEPA